MHNMQKYGEIFLNRDLVRYYVCSACNAVDESSNVVGDNNHFVTNEVCKFWRHVQQCHGDVAQLRFANFQKELSPEPAKNKLEIDNVIVIEDDNDENKLLSEDQRAVSSNQTSDQNNQHLVNEENSGSLLVSLLKSTPNKLNKPESPKISEEILMDCQPKDEIMSIIESQLRAMHGCTIEIDENKEETMQEDAKISNEPLENELQAKLNVGILNLDNFFNEDVVDLNEAMEREDKSVAEVDDDCATIQNDYFDHNDVTIKECEISKAVDILNVAKKNTFKEYLSKNNNNDNNNNNYEIDPEIIELNDSDEEDTGTKVEEVKEKGVILHTDQINIPVHGSIQAPQRSQAHNEIIQQIPTINFQEQDHQNNQSNNLNNQSNNHSNQGHNHNNQGNIPNNQISSNVGLATSLDMLTCNFCERRFYAVWQKKRHEKIHLRSQNISADKIIESPIRKTKQRRLRDFKCPACGTTTVTKENMSKHIHTHHSEIQFKHPVKPFQCQHCSRNYSSKAALSYHVKHIHANLPTTSAAAPDAASATSSVPCDSSLATPPESNTSNYLLQQQADMMNCFHRWHMESSYQPAWLTDSAYNSMESIGTLLPASCESES